MRLRRPPPLSGVGQTLEGTDGAARHIFRTRRECLPLKHVIYSACMRCSSRWMLEAVDEEVCCDVAWGASLAASARPASICCNAQLLCKGSMLAWLWLGTCACADKARRHGAARGAWCGGRPWRGFDGAAWRRPDLAAGRLPHRTAAARLGRVRGAAQQRDDDLAPQQGASSNRLLSPGRLLRIRHAMKDQMSLL